MNSGIEMSGAVFKNISRGLQALVVLLVLQLLTFICQQIVMGVERMIRTSSEEFKLLEGRWQQRANELWQRADRVTEKITAQGEILLFSYDYSDRDSALLTVRDVHSNILWQGSEKDLPFTCVKSSYCYRDLSWGPDIWLLSVPVELGRSIEVTVFENGRAVEFWRFVPQKGVFEGYTDQRKRIGCIGASGFSSEWNDVRSFADARTVRSGPENVYYVVGDYSVHSVDFAGRASQEVFRSATAKIIGTGYQRTDRARDDERQLRYRPYLRVLTEDGTERLFIEDPDERVIFHLPKDWDFWRMQMAVTDERVLLWYERSYQQGQVQPELLEKDPNAFESSLDSYQTVSTIEVYEVTGSGALKKLSSLERKTPTIPWGSIYRFFSVRSTPAVVTAFSPLFYRLKFLQEENSERAPFVNQIPLWSMLSEMVKDSRPVNLLYCLIAGCLCVVLALWHGWARRTGSVRLTAWLTFVAVFNLAGLLTYLALNHTPVVSCPACGKRRGLEIVECIRCGAELPKPKLRDVDKVLITKSVND